MKGNPDILSLLNDILTNELTSINQYFIHAKMCDNWGYERLAKKVHDESIEEMKHADELIERVLYLEGVPNLQKLNKLQVGQTVEEQLKSDLGLEKAAIDLFNKGIQKARDLGDNGTEELLSDMLTDEEEHANWLEAQLELISQVGLQNYLAEQIRG